MSAPVPHHEEREPPDDAAVIELWLRGRPPTTRRAYEGDVGVFHSVIGRPLRQVTSADTLRFVAELQGSPATRARRIATMKSLFGFAYRVGYLPEDPARNVKLPSVPKRLHERVLAEDEVSELIKEADAGRNRVLLRTLYFGGLRIQEAVGLRWRDIGRKWISVRGKGSKFRTVLVPEELVGELRTLRGKHEGDEGFVFKGRNEAAITSGHGRRIVRAAGMEALAKAVSPHWLRHSHACHSVEHGVPLHVLQASLGHASLSTTAMYLHVRPGQGSSQYLTGDPRSGDGSISGCGQTRGCVVFR